MFERFTDRARRVVVLAQEEARGLEHNYIGTEHLLLALLAESDGLAARALRRFGMNLEGTREEVIARVGKGDHPPKGKIPFTPRAKKVLEFALREALRLGHNYIGTEHLLLGLLREADGVGPKIIAARAGDLGKVRVAVIGVLGEMKTQGRVTTRPWVRTGEPGESGAVQQLAATPATDTSLAEALRLAGDSPVGSHHLLLAALSDPETAAAKTLAALGVDLDQAREALRHADVTGTSDELPEERGRRHMTLRVTDNLLIVQVTDPVLVDLARAAAGALAGAEPDTMPAETIPGDRPASASLGTVWQSLRDSLKDIKDRATPGGGDPKPGAGEPGKAG